MHKLNERLSPIQRRNVKLGLDRSLSRRGNIDRGSGISPIALQRARTKRDTSLSRKGNIQRGITHEREYGQQLASTDRGITAYNKLFEMLTENTPSKTEIAVRQSLGWDIRPEDEPGIDNTTKRIRVRTRKNSEKGVSMNRRRGTLMSTGGKKRLSRKLASDELGTDTEKGAVAHMLAHKTKQGDKRRIDKGHGAQK